MRPAIAALLAAAALSGCSVVTAGVAVTSAAITVGSAAVSTAATVGAAAVKGAVKLGEAAIDAATAPSEPTNEVTLARPSAPDALAERAPPEHPASAASPCCTD